jgi:hypothetical protein
MTSFTRLELMTLTEQQMHPESEASNPMTQTRTAYDKSQRLKNLPLDLTLLLDC